MDDSRSQGFVQVSVPEGYERFMLRQLFEPWAAELLRRADLRPGWSVLDVASGPGPVARLAAAALGPGGRVVASDISEPMLALAAARPAPAGAARIEFLACPASEIDTPDDGFDAVLCQHGLQFFAGKQAAVREMRRVARPGGIVVVSTWAAERPLGLFAPMAETLAELGVAEPYPRAFDPESYRLGAGDLTDLLRASGWRDAQVETVELDATWDSAEQAADTVAGTPFGPLVSALSAHVQQQVRARLITKLGRSGDGVTVRTASNIARGVK
jgi:ubiquinone/menaquinone biosynthesis C-methylase UbiE